MCLKTISEDEAPGRVAQKVASDASRATEHDIASLRAAGFTDVQISDVALCAALRCFVARFYDATGAGPETGFPRRGQ